MPFPRFGTLHAIVLAMALLAVVGTFVVGRSLRSARAKRLVALALALGNASMYVWATVLEVRDGTWSPREGFPLHLCDLSALIIAHALATSRRRSFELGYYLGISGGLSGLVLPQVTHVDAYFVPFFVWHELLILGPVYLVAAYGLAPSLRGIAESLALTVLLVVPVGVVDLALGANYMFLRHKPRGAEAFPGAWPWYLPNMLLFGAVLFLVLWLPFGLASRRRMREPARAG